MARTPAANG